MIALFCLTASSCLRLETANSPIRMSLFEDRTGKYFLVVMRSGSAGLVSVFRAGRLVSSQLVCMLDSDGVRIDLDYVRDAFVSPTESGDHRSCVLEIGKESGMFFDSCFYSHPERIAQVVLDVGEGPNATELTFGFPFSLVKQRLQREIVRNRGK